MPFEGWTSDAAARSLEWWESYNSVKHGRSMNYKQANLKNVLHALAALYLLEMYRIKEISQDEVEPDVPLEKSALFEIQEWNTKWTDATGMMFVTEEL